MGSFLSRPEKPKTRVLVPAKRNSSALRHRISMNKETLDRFLQHIGHPVRESSPMSMQRRRRESRRPSNLCKRMLSRRKTPNRPSAVCTTSAKQVDTNSKPLPPLPLLVTKPQQSAQPENKQQPPTQQQNNHQPGEPSHAIARPPQPVAADYPPGTSRLEAKLEREYIERQREKTLRKLESRNFRVPKTLQQLESKNSRVPDIIFRRIQMGSPGMLFGSFDSRATRRKRRSSGLAWDHQELFQT